MARVSCHFFTISTIFIILRTFNSHYQPPNIDFVDMNVYCMVIVLEQENNYSYINHDLQPSSVGILYGYIF